MRLYSEAWDYYLYGSSSPYALNNGGAYASGGLLYVPYDSFVNKGTAGTYVFTSNYDGNYAVLFTLDTTNASGLTFTGLVYGSNVYVPAVRAIAGTGLQLGWAMYTYGITGSGSSDPGDFNGQIVPEVGQYKVMFVRKVNTDMFSDYYTLVAAHVISPSGVSYTSGWNRVYDSYKHIQLGCTRGDSGSGYMTVSTLSVADQLTETEANTLLAVGAIDTNPAPSISPSSGTQGGPTTVTMTPPASLPAGWTLRYTTDGTDPTATSTVYAAPFIVGSPFNPGSSVSVRAAYFNDNYPTTEPEHGRIVANTYSYQLTPPEFNSTSWYFNDNAPITWTNPPTDSNVQFVYTMDGSDPTTSPTARVWVDGDVFPFGTNLMSTTPSYYQYADLKSAAKYVPNGSFSSVTDTQIVFVLGQGQIASALSGAYNDDVRISLTIGSQGPSGITLVHDVTLNGVTTRYDHDQILTIPFSASGPYTMSIRTSTPDGLIYADWYDPYTYSPTFGISFYQATPVFDKKLYVASSTVNITAANPNGSLSTLRYTTDGTDPTVSSPVLAGSITANVNQIVKVVAIRNGVFSTIASTKVLSEYQVVESITTVEDANYHYYVAEQRISMSSLLGQSADVVTVGTNTTPDKVSVTVDNVTTDLCLWDSTDPSGAFNKFEEMLWFAQPTKFWSRLAYAAGTFSFDWVYSEGLFTAAPSVDLIALSVVSRKHIVTFTYRINTVTGASTIRRVRTDIGVGTTSETVTSGAMVTAGHNTFTVTVGAGSVTFADGSGTSTETNADFTAGTIWSIEGVVNPAGLQGSNSSPSVAYTSTVGQGIQCHITTTAVSGYLRRAPASLAYTTASATATGSVSIDFRDQQSIRSVRHSRLTTDQNGSGLVIEAPALIGFNDEDGVVELTGQFAVAFPGAVDVTHDFDAMLDVSTDFSALLADPSASVGSTAFPSVTLYMEPVTSALNENATPSVGITCRMYVPSTSGPASIHLELHSDGFAPSRVALTSSTRRLHLKLSGRSGGISVIAVIDGVETTVATLPAITDGNLYEIRFKRSGPTYQPRRQVTQLNSYAFTGTLSKVMCSNPVLVGADFVFHGAAAGFGPTALTISDGQARAVYFNPTTGSVTAEAIAFEPSDGRLLVGVLEASDGNYVWTNTMYSRLVKVHKESAGSPLDGGIIGIGSNISIRDHRLYWTEAGIPRSTAVGNLTWNTPISHQDARARKQIIRTYEPQRINISASKVAH